MKRKLQQIFVLNPDCSNIFNFNFTESKDVIYGVKFAVNGDMSMTQDLDPDQDGQCALM